jgi:predicted acylesterase/phospholipase RssA
MCKTDNTNQFHILALSGGGFRGLFTAVILEKLEEDFGYPIAKKFDLLSGTSIGGIIALALAAEIPAKTIKGLLIDNKNKIFGSPHLFQGYCCRSRYNNESLTKFLHEIFEDQKIRDLKHRVIIPTINYTEGSPQILKTRHHENFKNDLHWSLVHAALATSAAPIYFPLFRSKNGDFIDGGIVANHPGIFSFIEAQKFLNIQPTNIFQLHIGTTIHKVTSSARKAQKKTGLFIWRENLLNLLFSCQEQSTEQMLSFLLEDRYYSVNSICAKEQSQTIGLDKISENAVNLLTQKATESYKKFQGNKFYEIIRSHNADEFIPIPLDGGPKR